MAIIDFTRKYMFPIQFCCAMAGNTLNLIVLNTHGMRTKTNFFLSAMAIADLCFFASLFPIYLDVYIPAGIENAGYHWFHYYSQIPLSTLANCFSAASIWITVGVTLERVMAIRFPFLARTYWKKSRIIKAIVLIYIASFLLSSYQMLWRKPKKYPEGTLLPPSKNDYVYVNETAQPGLFWFVHVSHLLFGTVVIAIPLLVITVLNSILIYHLRANKRSMRGFRRSSAQRIKKSEQKVTFLVVILIIFFVVAYVPSGIMTVWGAAAEISRLQVPAQYWNAVEICNMLVCTGKAINFVLYCSASSNFRGKVVRLFGKKSIVIREKDSTQLTSNVDRTKAITPEQTEQTTILNDLTTKSEIDRQSRRSNEIRFINSQAKMLENLNRREQYETC